MNNTCKLKRYFFVCIGFVTIFELMQSSSLLELRSIITRREDNYLKNENNGLLKNILTRTNDEPIPAVWFAPYFTFPEAGILESQIRSGVYDTFLSFPTTGIKSNFGAFKLSPADQAFAQASSQGINAEASLAKRLGYRLLAIDLGAIQNPEAAVRLCTSSNGCLVSTDGYALFKLDSVNRFKDIKRRIPLLPQRYAAPRWGGFIFSPNHWIATDLRQAPSSNFTVRGGINPSLKLYRMPKNAIPKALNLELNDYHIILNKPSNLSRIEICIGSLSQCDPIVLSSARSKIEITNLLPEGRISTLNLVGLWNANGLPSNLSDLERAAGAHNQASWISATVGKKSKSSP